MHQWVHSHYTLVRTAIHSSTYDWQLALYLYCMRPKLIHIVVALIVIAYLIFILFGVFLCYEAAISGEEWVWKGQCGSHFPGFAPLIVRESTDWYTGNSKQT